MWRNHFTTDYIQSFFFFFFTCAIVTVHQTGDVGFGLAGYQMWGAELFQYTIVVVLINHPLVIDPKEDEERRKEKYIYITIAAISRARAFWIKNSAVEVQLVSYLTYWSLPPTAKWCVFAGLTKMVYSPTFLSPSFTTTSLLPNKCSGDTRGHRNKQSLWE